jgi:hypothetical protein
MEARWLSSDSAAKYLDIKVDALKRLVKSGKLPSPDYSLGPKSPRYDKTELDKVFNKPTVITPDQKLEKWRENFEKKAKAKSRTA